MSAILTRQILKPVATLFAVALMAFQIYATGGFVVLDAPIQRSIHLGLIMVLVFLWRPGITIQDGQKEPVVLIFIDIFLALAAMSVMAYVCAHNFELLNRVRYIDPVTTSDYVAGIVATLLVLEITRRTAGMPLVIVSVISLLYALFGQYLPGAMKHNGVLHSDLLEQLFLTTDGLYGIPLAAAATMIFAFVMFGAFLEKANMSAVFMDLACLLTRRSMGGPAKVSIFASALFGTISGSAPANVYGTGTFTIPLMKRVGYSPAFSGAVEAVASTGGQIMPPIMGAAAFIMADLVGMSYLEVAKAALLPSILYYLALLAMIHFEAMNKNIGVLPADQVPPTRSVLIRLYYILPIFVLITALIMGRSVVSCAFIGTISVIVLGLFREESRLTPKRLMDSIETTAKNALMISACCACAGIVVAVISLTGVGYKFISFVTLVVGNNLFLLMLCLMVTCMVLGMGVPTSPAYIIVAALGAPALVKAGVPIIAAHMFVFYYAILSAITPPVCVASFSGAAIAGAKAMETGWVSVKLGIVAFIIPFMFVYQPALLLQGEAVEVSIACVTSIIGVLGMAGGLQGYLLRHCLIWERPLLIIGGLTLIYPGLTTDLIGFGLLGLVVLSQLTRGRFSRFSTTDSTIKQN